jgi:ABC-2 type transport system permease protein
MSHPATLDTPGHALRRVPTTEVAQPVTQARVIASEWLKFRTLRSTVAVLAAAVLGMLVLGLVIAYNTRHLAGLAPEDAAASGTLQGYYLGQLLIGALGVLFVTGEYSTGMIRSTLAAVPRRQPVLRAKLVVFTLTDPTALRVVIGTGVYLTLIGLLGGALGWIVRSTPGALVAVLGLILVVPVLFGELLGHWGKRVAEFLPTGAGASFSTTVREPETLAPWVGLAVMAAWVVVATVIASLVLQRRDA